MILGDFNSVLTSQDRVNGLPVLITRTQDFQKCLHDLQLGQLDRRGYEFSWCNKREVNDKIYNSINWAFGNIAWFSKYGHIVANYLQPSCSNHSSILLDIISPTLPINKPFRLLTVLLRNHRLKT